MTTEARFDVFEHAPPLHLALQPADAGLDRGMSFGLLVFVAQLLPAHAQIASQLMRFDHVIRARPQKQD